MNPIVLIIVINLLFFLPTMASPEIRENLILYMGLRPDSILDRPWTVLTSMFIHADFFHIFANMFTLYFFGSYVYRLLGERRFLTVYFGGGILGSLFFILLGPQFAIAVGASGAVFAVGGALVALRPSVKVFIFPIPVPLPLWVAVIGGFLILSFIPGIAWEAHLGGILFGLGAGYLYKRKRYYY
jgi:membrane associated rhomboid family serine protease